MQSVLRRASHAGSWYSSSANELDRELSNWLSNATANYSPAKAIISPHAGYAFCGPCAAHAYKQIDFQSTNRLFILGPSHHYHLSGCALSTAHVYQTPLYDLTIDRDVCTELYSTNYFDTMSLNRDEQEHSIEMQLSYIAKVMSPKGQNNFKIVPILVGALSNESEALYGKLLAKYLLEPGNVFVISSDFCHWGSRFNYQFYNKNWGEIYESIERLDKMGMEIIEKMKPEPFAEYLNEYRNTICGRHPIAVLLNAIDHLQTEGQLPSSSLHFINYAQSSQCTRMRDSSVSYAAASFVMNS